MLYKTPPKPILKKKEMKTLIRKLISFLIPSHSDTTLVIQVP